MKSFILAVALTLGFAGVASACNPGCQNKATVTNHCQQGVVGVPFYGAPQLFVVNPQAVQVPAQNPAVLVPNQGQVQVYNQGNAGVANQKVVTKTTVKKGGRQGVLSRIRERRQNRNKTVTKTTTTVKSTTVNKGTAVNNGAAY